MADLEALAEYLEHQGHGTDRELEAARLLRQYAAEREYVYHKYDCQRWDEHGGDDPKWHCTCGLDALREKVDAPKEDTAAYRAWRKQLGLDK